jgi:hypothetical protein
MAVQYSIREGISWIAVLSTDHLRVLGPEMGTPLPM